MNYLARSDDTAITHALGSLLYSAAYLIVTVITTVGILFFGMLLIGGDEWIYFFASLIVWGGFALHFLTENRRIGLRHSAAGIALEEIESQEALAKFVIEKHIELIRDRWTRKS